MKTSRWIWGVWILVALCYIVPYTVFTDVHAWYGSFLLWTVVGVLVIITNVLITRKFTDE